MTSPRNTVSDKPVLVLAGAFALFLLIVYVSGSRSLCLLRTITGLPCPGCGLTTAATALLHGDFPGALKASPVIFALPAIAAAIILEIRSSSQAIRKSVRIFYIVILTLIIGFYIYRMIRYFPDGPMPMMWLENNYSYKIYTLLTRIFQVIQSFFCRG